MTITFNRIVKILVEKLGVVTLDEMSEDFCINEYVPDSITFIQFIVELEKEFGHDLPDEFLQFEVLESAKGLSEKLDDFLETVK